MNIQLFDKKLERFIYSLEKYTLAKVLRTIDLLQKFGSQLGMPQSKKVDRKLFELRIRGVQEVRIFYTFKNNKAILLHGYLKKSQKIPKKELQAAQECLLRLDSSITYML